MGKLIAFSLFIPLLIAACGDTVKQYKKSEIEIIKIDQSGPGYQLVYRPILDSLYYCAGVNIKSDGNRHKLSFLRCKINEKCAADIPAENLPEDQLRLLVPGPLENTDVVFQDGEWPLASLGH